MVSALPQSALACARVGSLLLGLSLLVGCDRALPTPSKEPLAQASRDLDEAGDEAESNTPVAGATPFAVIELFTSEGCSSCPPADRLLTELAQRGDAGQRVYALSFHVDYWNYLGWQDPFSDEAYSKRQRWYAGTVFDGRVYTPQAVVNGEVELVGSKGSVLNDAVDIALKRPSNLVLSMEVHGRDAQLDVSYDVPGASADDVLRVALVERSTARDVSAGENEGRKLRHRNVVRAFVSEPLAAETGHLSLRKPKDTSESLDVIAYVQEPKGRIVAATRAANETSIESDE